MESRVKPWQDNLPRYSPDFNAIENAFSKLKAILRKAAARTIDNLWDVICDALPHFTSWRPSARPTTTPEASHPPTY